MLGDIKPKQDSIPFQVISVYDLARYVKNIADRTQFCKIAIIGSQGTGKTNIAVALCNYLNKMLSDDVIHIYARSNNIIPLLADVEALRNIIRMNAERVGYLSFVLDDFSYVLETSSEMKNLIKHNYTKLRHIYKNKKLISIVTIHYKKAIQPLLRDTYIRIYTHMNNEQLDDMRDNYKMYVYGKNFIKYINYYYIYNRSFLLNALLESRFRIMMSQDGRYASICTSCDNADIIDNNGRVSEKTNCMLSISKDNERLAIVDFGTDCKYLYYNIIYNERGLFSLDNVRIIGTDNESFDVSNDRIINIDRLSLSDSAPSSSDASSSASLSSPASSSSSSSPSNTLSVDSVSSDMSVQSVQAPFLDYNVEIESVNEDDGDSMPRRRIPLEERYRRGRRRRIRNIDMVTGYQITASDTTK